jgi:hypothetical protein
MGERLIFPHSFVPQPSFHLCMPEWFLVLTLPLAVIIPFITACQSNYPLGNLLGVQLPHPKAYSVNPEPCAAMWTDLTM